MGKKQHRLEGNIKFATSFAAVPGHLRLSSPQACDARLLAYLFGFAYLIITVPGWVPGCGGQRHSVEPVLSQVSGIKFKSPGLHSKSHALPNKLGGACSLRQGSPQPRLGMNSCYVAEKGLTS